MQGCRAIICMPVLAPDIKVQAVKRLGGIVKLVGETYTETQMFAQVRLEGPMTGCCSLASSQADSVSGKNAYVLVCLM